MIDIKILREHPEIIREAAKAKGVVVDTDRIIELDTSARALLTQIETTKAQKNAASDAIAQATPEERQALIEAMRAVDQASSGVEAQYATIASELNELLLRIPNPAQDDVIVGASDEENTTLRTVGEIPVFDFEPKDHQTLGENLGIIDMKRAAKVSGARFVYYIGDGAMLELALVDLGLRIAMKHGFVPITVPHLITSKAMAAMGYLEHGGQDEIYYLQKDDLYLIGTSEQSIGPMHMDELLDPSVLPLRYVGVSPCYRRESGSAGKDTKGVIRVHQFTKVEMFGFCKAEDSIAEHEAILAIEEELLQALGLPYHVLNICTGDLGLPAAKKWDTEVWFPAQNRYREVTSTSNCTDFQGRRLNTRYRTETGTEVIHTVNGTAFSGRPIAAILENFQNADGSVTIPEVLRPYMGGKTTITTRT